MTTADVCLTSKWKTSRQTRRSEGAYKCRVCESDGSNCRADIASEVRFEPATEVLVLTALDPRARGISRHLNKNSGFVARTDDFQKQRLGSSNAASRTSKKRMTSEAR
jgi:hypothetical protein